MEQQRTLSDLLADPVESTRVLTMADLLFQIETYTRNLSLMVGGLIAKNADTDTARSLFGLQQSLDETGLWLKGHYEPLYAHVQTPAPFPQAEAVAAESDGKVLH